jgi:hypothetical protein
MTAKQRDDEFAQYVKGQHESQRSYRRYVLSQLTDAQTNMRRMITMVDEIKIALRSGAIDDHTALADLAQLGALWFLQPQEPPFAPHDVEAHNGL